MDSYIKATGIVLYPYVFEVGPNKHDGSCRAQLRGHFCQPSHVQVKLNGIGQVPQPLHYFSAFLSM